MAKEEAEEAPKAEGDAAAAEAKPKGKKKLIIIIVVVLALLGGVGGFLMMGGSKEEKHETEEHPPEIHRADLGNFIVNLSDKSSFLKVKLLIEYDAAAMNRAIEKEHAGGGSGGHGSGGGEGGEGGLPAPLLEREPIIRDAIVRVMSSKKAEDVLTSNGKDQLKEELVEAINEATGFEEPVVINIYFTEFIVQ